MPTIPKSTILNAKQIDLLQKFIRLANDNPNDHEANLAARKACKMLDGYLFPLITHLQTPPSPPPPWSGFDDIFRAAKAQQEEYYRQQRETSQREENRRREEARNRQQYDPNKWDWPGNPPPGSNRETRRGRTEQQKEPNKGEGDPFKEYRQGFDYNDFFRGTGVPEKRNLKCSKCGHIKSTRFRGPESVWICMECRGKEYTESKL